MKQFLDFLPLVVFFAFYKLYDIYAATTALIIATAVVLIYSWVRYRKVEKMALAAAGLVPTEYRLGGVLYSLRSCQYLHCLLVAAKHLGQL